MDFGKMEEEYFCERGLNDRKRLKGGRNIALGADEFDGTGRPGKK
jgi:hypothetical protein